MNLLRPKKWNPKNTKPREDWRERTQRTNKNTVLSLGSFRMCVVLCVNALYPLTLKPMMSCSTAGGFPAVRHGEVRFGGPLIFAVATIRTAKMESGVLRWPKRWSARLDGAASAHDVHRGASAYFGLQLLRIWRTSPTAQRFRHFPFKLNVRKEK